MRFYKYLDKLRDEIRVEAILLDSMILFFSIIITLIVQKIYTYYIVM